jgi:hypothetical protein
MTKNKRKGYAMQDLTSLRLKDLFKGSKERGRVMGRAKDRIKGVFKDAN